MVKKGMAGLASDKSESMTIREGKVRDLRTKFTEDSSISQAMLEMAQECVEAMNNEVTGLRARLTKTSQEAKEKVQQEKPAVSGSGMSHK